MQGDFEVGQRLYWSNRGGQTVEGRIVGYGFHPEYGDVKVAKIGSKISRARHKQGKGNTWYQGRKLLSDSIMWDNDDLDLANRRRDRLYTEERIETPEVTVEYEYVPATRRQGMRMKGTRTRGERGRGKGKRATKRYATTSSSGKGRGSSHRRRGTG